MLGITPNDIDGLQIIGLPKKVIRAKLNAMKAAGLIQVKRNENKFSLTNQGEIAFRSLLKLFEF
jgi:DNA-binding transcriptional regulator PaaX